MRNRAVALGALLLVPSSYLVACGSDGTDAVDGSSTTGAEGGVDPNSPNSPGAPQGTEPTDDGCGGSTHPPCDDGKKCFVGKDCTSKSCQNGICTAASPTDGIKNADETDIDCGGSASPKCSDGKTCAKNDDCETGFCSGTGVCVAPAIDGVKNGDETDVDCGGSKTPKCADGKACVDGPNCESGVCDPGAKTCTPPTYTDGVKNGPETDIDCGGNAAAPGFKTCADTKGCAIGDDCTSKVCDPVNKACDVPTYADGVKNGDETDVDCGGEATAPGFQTCADTKGCVAGTDCASKVCGGTTCSAPSYTDNVRNGDETDVDCGGARTNPGFKGCAADKSCTTHTDCASQGCAWNNKCAIHASCTQENGGMTCGPNGNESCCKDIAVTAGAAFGGNFKVDKYLVTAGRMRAFVDRVNGNVKGWVTANTPAWWDARWTNWLPISKNGHLNDDYGQPVPATGLMANDGRTIDHINISSAYAQLAGGIIHDAPASQGCSIGSSYGHPTFFVPKADAVAIYGDNYDRWIPQSALDKRPLNCTTFVMFAALCAFDGGQVISEPEYAFLYDANGNPSGTNYTTTTAYPWGATPTAGGFDTINGAWTRVGPAHTGGTAACPDCTIDRINWRWSWQDPTLDADAVPADAARRNRDQSFFISPPGTFPLGGSRLINGDSVQDLAGLMIEITRSFQAADSPTPTKTWPITFGDADASNDRTSQALQNIHWRGGSFEGHGVKGVWNTDFSPVAKYGKSGSRCVYR